MNTDDLIVARDGAVGRLRLHRPKALHALNQSMCEGMLAALGDWYGDEGVRLIMIDHADGRGFCAGGDIRMLAASGAGDGVEARRFFHTEYRLNHRLFTYAKPTVAFMDGVTMGGGVGISMPCRYRVATENTRFAMPETGIGLFPDVGGGWYLSRLPGRIGQYLALTGARIDDAACIALGLATHFIPSGALDDVKAAIVADPTAIETTLAGATAPAEGEPAVIRHRADIDRLFASDRLEDVLDALMADDGDFARATLATLATKSPQTMKVSLRLLAEGALTTDFADEMAREYVVATRVVQRHDFLEGVRAVIVDKDNAPRWNPADAGGVSAHVIDQIFAPLTVGEAWTPHD